MGIFFNKKNLFYRMPVLGFCILIFWQSSQPASGLPQLFTHQDKLVHLIIYLVLGLLAARALYSDKPLWSAWQIGLASSLFALFYGLSDEFHQLLVPGRDASFFDWTADTIGGITGSYLWAILFFPQHT